MLCTINIYDFYQLRKMTFSTKHWMAKYFKGKVISSSNHEFIWKLDNKPSPTLNLTGQAIINNVTLVSVGSCFCISSFQAGGVSPGDAFPVWEGHVRYCHNLVCLDPQESSLAWDENELLAVPGEAEQFGDRALEDPIDRAQIECAFLLKSKRTPY